MEHNPNEQNLSAAEIAHLWTSYIINSKSKYLLMYAMEKAEDQDIKAVMQQAFYLASGMLEDIEKIFNTVNHPIPYAFKEDDVRVDAEKLYSDILLLNILKSYTTFGLTNYGTSLSTCARTDVRAFFTSSLKATIELLNTLNDIAINKGIFVRSPKIPVPKNIEYAHSQSIMGAFLGHKRPLNSLEIAHIFNISHECGIRQGLLTGLAQTVEKQSLRDYFAKGRKMMIEHLEALNVILSKEHLSYPSSYEAEVSNTTDRPFSDKISAYFGVSSIVEVISCYSQAKANSLRKDIFLVLTQLSAEVTMYIKDGMDIMIDNSWYEEMPKNIDREDLIEGR